MNRADVIEFRTADDADINRFIEEGLRGRADNTIKAYRQSLERFKRYLNGAGTDLRGYARSDVQAYVKRLETVEKRKPSGVNREYAAIRAFSKWAGKSEAIEDIRIIRIARNHSKAPKWLSRNKRNEIIRLTDRKANKRDHAIVMTLLGAGLRVGELVALDRSDVTIGERKGEVHVRDGKGGIERTISIGAETRRAIRIYLEQRGNDRKEALFTSQLGKRISRRSVQTMLKHYEVTPHQLRHTYVKQLVDNGHGTALIMSLSGHTSADMIAWYSSPSEEEKAKAIENLYD
ncbi:tyrosine-type recombinase/integrase [Virgibacillus sp. W0430]|uniref:tyrosine-type recombinase/integrase n=1 Tax=Virgibacillus sp. W0430 TaxID=3391580 RepID=UPI003F46651F